MKLKFVAKLREEIPSLGEWRIRYQYEARQTRDRSRVLSFFVVSVLEVGARRGRWAALTRLFVWLEDASFRGNDGVLDTTAVRGTMVCDILVYWSRVLEARKYMPVTVSVPCKQLNDWQ